MKFIKILASSLLMAAVFCLFVSCDDEENTLSRAVMVSASSLTFDVYGGTQTITIYADKDWICECPDWVTIYPETGTGVTDVDVTVGDNYRDGAPDRPRSATLIFEGCILDSQAPMLVNQDGDKYRDVADYTVSQIGSLTNGDVLSIPSAYISNIYSDGFMVTNDFKSFNYVSGDVSDFTVGDEISILGDKTTSNGLPVINLDIYEILSSGNAVSFPTPTDITGSVDTYSSSTWDYVSVDGSFKGTSSILSVSSAVYSINILDEAEEAGLGELIGHKATITGFYAGTAAPYIRMYVNGSEDNGSAYIYYFSEDFEWLEPWSDSAGAIDSIAENTTNTDNVKQLGASATSYNGQTAYEALTEKGYTFEATHLGTSVAIQTNCGYLQRNYLKFGKTDYQAAIILPSLEEDIPEGSVAYLSFDWSPMMQGSGTMDSTTLTVTISTGSEKKSFAIPPHGIPSGTMQWVSAEVDISGVTLTTDTKIEIAPDQWDYSSTYRWFIDNIYVYIEAD